MGRFLRGHDLHCLVWETQQKRTHENRPLNPAVRFISEEDVTLTTSLQFNLPYNLITQDALG